MNNPTGSLSNGQDYTYFARIMQDGIKVSVSFGWTFELGYFITVDNHSTYRMKRQEWLDELLKRGIEKEPHL